jgi:hypothetical protein
MRREIQFEKYQIEWIEKMSKKCRMSPAEVVRRCVIQVRFDGLRDQTPNTRQLGRFRG